MRTAPRWATLFYSVLLLLGLALPASAAPPATPNPVLAADDGSGEFSAKRILRWTMGSQRRMLQVATIGMCFGLWIMMKK